MSLLTQSIREVDEHLLQNSHQAAVFPSSHGTGMYLKLIGLGTPRAELWLFFFFSLTVLLPEHRFHLLPFPRN